MSEDFQKLYTDIYSTDDWYGNAEKGRCPAVRLYPKYMAHISGNKVLDVGCGRGHLVELLRKDGYDATGVDFIIHDEHEHLKYANITEPMTEYQPDTIISIDVLEHIPEADLPAVLDNLARAGRAIVSVHNGTSKHEGVELHVTRWSMDVWRKFFEQRFNVIEEHVVAVYRDGQQNLFIMDRRDS